MVQAINHLVLYVEYWSSAEVGLVFLLINVYSGHQSFAIKLLTISFGRL